jgi:peptidoglycan hydrolase CwlO-like protein
MIKKETDAHTREVTNEDVAIVERAIAEHATFQTFLFTLQRLLIEVGRLDMPSIKRGIQAEQARMDDVRKQADAAQQHLTQLDNQIKDKQRELVEVEMTIKERNGELNRLHEGYHNLRNLLAAA